MYSEYYIIDNTLSDRLDFREDDCPLVSTPKIIRKEWNVVEENISLKWKIYYIKFRIGNRKIYTESTKSNSLEYARKLLAIRKEQYRNGELNLNNSSLLQAQRGYMRDYPPISA